MPAQPLPLPLDGRTSNSLFPGQRSRTPNPNAHTGEAERYTQSMRRPVVPILLFLLSIFSTRTATAQSPAPPGEISADLGPCFAAITVTGADSKPIYGARITARVQYGVMGIKKLDLEAYTGTDGKLKITRLPESLKKPMIIHIGKDEKQVQVEFKPTLNCHATFDVQLR